MEENKEHLEKVRQNEIKLKEAKEELEKRGMQVAIFKNKIETLEQKMIEKKYLVPTFLKRLDDEITEALASLKSKFKSLKIYYSFFKQTAITLEEFSNIEENYPKELKDFDRTYRRVTNELEKRKEINREEAHLNLLSVE